MDIQGVSKIIQPVYHNTKIRTVFSLGNMKLSSDLRLTGVKSTDPDKKYIASLGVWSLIDKLYLYDGETLLSSNENVAYFMSFLALNHGNSDNISKYSKAYRLKGGFKVGVNGLYDFSDNQQFLIEDTNSKDGWLNLKDVLWMLKYTPLLQFQNLRLVIEWNQAEFTGAFVAEEPSLICLEIIGKINMQPFEYYDIELDRSFIPLVANNTLQTVERNIDAFTGKTVAKLLIGFRGDDPADSYFTTYSSLWQPYQEITIYNGNIPITPSPIDNTNNLGYLESSWGPINMPAGCQLNPQNAEKDKVMLNTYRNVFGSYSWTGINVDSSQPVTNIKMRYKRQGGAALGHGKDLNVYVFGLVKKAVGENKNDQAVVGLL